MDILNNYRSAISSMEKTENDSYKDINNLKSKIQKCGRKYQKLVKAENQCYSNNKEIEAKENKILAKYPDTYTATYRPNMTKADINRINKLDDKFSSNLRMDRIRYESSRASAHRTQMIKDLKKSLDNFVTAKLSIPNADKKLKIASKVIK